MIERRTWRTVRTIALPWFGSIFDIRLIDRPDLCHHQHVLSSAPAIDPEATDRYHRMTQRSRWQSNPRPAPLVGDVLPSMVAVSLLSRLIRRMPSALNDFRAPGTAMRIGSMSIRKGRWR